MRTRFSQDDSWRQLALWAFHQALGIHEKRAFAKGLPLHPHEVAFGEFDARMRANLGAADCWSDERAGVSEKDDRDMARWRLWMQFADVLQIGKQPSPQGRFRAFWSDADCCT